MRVMRVIRVIRVIKVIWVLDVWHIWTNTQIQPSTHTNKTNMFEHMCVRVS
jgi:hypothetical protein